MWMNLFANWGEQFRRPLFLGFVVLFVFLIFPARKGHPGKINRIPWYDMILMVVGAGSFFYFVVNNQSILARATRITDLEVALGVIGILVLGECCGAWWVSPSCVSPAALLSTPLWRVKP